MTASCEGELCIRMKPAGGAVADVLKECPPGFAGGLGRLVAFVHGYSDSYSGGTRNYEAFLKLLDAEWGPPPGRLVPDLGRLFWPGDKDWGMLSLISFPLELEPADESASRLAAFIETVGKRERPVRLDIIAHSLGCRVVLNALTILAKSHAGSQGTHMVGSVEVHTVCLMAGAVPVEYVGPGEKYWDGVSLPRRMSCLYSHADPVIGLAAPLGYTAAGERFFPPCIGYAGPPAGFPGSGEEIYGAGHGDYWAGEIAANRVAGMLDLGAVTWRIQERSVTANELPLPGETLTNELPVRDV